MNRKELARHFHKNQNWLYRKNGISRSLIHFYGDVTMKSIIKYKTYQEELVNNFYDLKVNKGKSYKELGEILYPDSKAPAEVAATLMSWCCSLREYNEFLKRTAVDRLIKLKEYYQ